MFTDGIEIKLKDYKDRDALMDILERAGYIVWGKAVIENKNKVDFYVYFKERTGEQCGV